MQADPRRPRPASRPIRADDDLRHAPLETGDGPVQLERVRKRPDLWLAGIVVMATVLLTLGFAGRYLLPAGNSESADANLRGAIGIAAQPALAVLGAGEESGGSTANVAVRLLASRAVGLVRVSVDYQGMVLGSENASLATPGESIVAFPVLRPQLAVEAKVEVATDPGGAVLARAPVVLSAAGQVQVWQLVASRLPAGRTRVEIEALAPAGVAGLRVSFRSESGVLLGEAVATRDAGANGQPVAAATFDLATFTGSTAVAGWTGDPMLLEIFWTDPTNGSRAELVSMKEVGRNWRWTVPARS